MDSKGGLISMNDDVKPAEGMLGSAIEFTPEAGSGTQVYFISVSGYSGNPGAVNTGAYTVTVKEVAHPPAGEGVDIPGTVMGTTSSPARMMQSPSRVKAAMTPCSVSAATTT